MSFIIFKPEQPREYREEVHRLKNGLEVADELLQKDERSGDSKPNLDKVKKPKLRPSAPAFEERGGWIVASQAMASPPLSMEAEAPQSHNQRPGHNGATDGLHANSVGLKPKRAEVLRTPLSPMRYTWGRKPKSNSLMLVWRALC